MPEITLASGFASAQWPARFQRHGRWVLDGAHNEDGARVLAASWRQIYPQVQATLFFSAVAQKDLQGILSHILPLAKQVVVAPLKSARAVPAEELKAEIQKLDPEIAIHVTIDVAAGRAAAEQFAGPLLCAGSLYLCGEMLSLLTPGTEFETSLQ